MIIEHVWPKSKLIIDAQYQAPMPEEGSAVEIQGDPKHPILPGVVIGILDADNYRMCAIDVDETLDGAQELAEWVQLNCEIGVRLLSPEEID